MVRPLNMINHLSLGHTSTPTLCQTPSVPNVTMEGAPVVVDNDLFLPHQYTPLDPIPHPSNIIAIPTNVRVAGKTIATELSLLNCGDVVQAIRPSKTNIGEPVGTGIRGPQSGPRSDYNVYISNWPVITYAPTQVTVRYQQGDPQRGSSDIVRWNCGRGPILPTDAYTDITVSGGGSEQVVRNFAGPPFSPRRGCGGLPNWAKFLEEPLRVAIKIREVVLANNSRSSQGYTEIERLDSNVLTYVPEEGAISGINNYSPGTFVEIVSGRLRKRADMVVIKYQPGFYYENSLRFPIERKFDNLYVDQQEIKIAIATTTNNCPQ